MVKFREPSHSPNELWELVTYDPETGTLMWREGSRKSGPAFNSKHVGGYRFGMHERSIYYAHRVAWAIYYGAWPIGELDHINGDKEDNRICNLREVTKVEQQQNLKLSARNTTGQMGVTWHAPTQKWHVTITVKGRLISSGYYGNYDDAVRRRKALEFWHGFHDNHGR